MTDELTKAQFRQVEALFHQARRLSETERAKFVSVARSNDPQIARELEHLLALHHQDDGSFLSDSPASRLVLDETPGPQPELPSQIGRYAIEACLGEGGMGLVYLARQDQPRRQVALKVLRAGLRSPRVQQRFEMEAEALGRLKHPGIAQVYEAGIAEVAGEHVPFIAMEHVDGKPITVHMRERGLGLAERVKLVAQACDAVQHAHQHGVIHRDLKPANMLVEGTGESARVRILDFGVARITDHDIHATQQTDMGQILGTLRYMSPEQASGDPHQVDARSDVYALGVILFEALTDHYPHDMDDLSVFDALVALREQPARSLTTFDRNLKGDLNTIAGKALCADPARRYASAAELGADLRRFLANEPITAHPPSAIYLMSKFARRHKSLVVSAGLITVLLVGSALLTGSLALRESQQRQIADQRFEDVRELARVFLFELDDQLRDVTGTLEARRTIVETGLAYLDRLARESAGDQTLRRELAMGYYKLGSMQGDPNRPNIGDTDGAAASLRTAARIMHDLEHETPKQYVDAAMVHTTHSDVLREMNRLDDAMQAINAALSTLERGLEAHPEEFTLRRNKSIVIGRQGRLFRRFGDEQAALAALHSEREIVQALATLRPEDESLKRDAGVLEFRFGMFLLNSDPTKAREHFLAFRDVSKELSAAHPNSAVYRIDMLTAISRAADCLDALGDSEGALRELEEAVVVSERHVAASPGDQRALSNAAVLYCRIGDMCLTLNRPEEAMGRFRSYLQAAETMASISPGNAAKQRELAVAQYKIGEVNMALAQSPVTANAERISHWQTARDWVGLSLVTFREMEQAGLLNDGDANVFEFLNSELATCETALERDSGNP